MNDLVLLKFAASDFEELLPMWRDGFEFGVGITDPNPLSEQANYFWTEVAPKNEIRAARHGGLLVGFVAATAESVAQLFVRVGYGRRGIGSAMLDWAKSESTGSHAFTLAEGQERQLRARRTRFAQAGELLPRTQPDGRTHDYHAQNSNAPSWEPLCLLPATPAVDGGPAPLGPAG